MNRKRSVAIGYCFVAHCVILLWFAPLAYAKETIKVITIDAPPWVARSPETGHLRGAFIDVIEELTLRTDYKFEITLTSFARVGRELERGTQDCTILAPVFFGQMELGELILEQPLGAIANKGVDLKSYEDLYDKRISVLRGVSLSSRFTADTELDKVFDKDYATGIRKLARERVDVVVGAIPTLKYIARTEGIESSLGQPLVLTRIPLLFQCSKKSAHLDAMEPINQAIKSMHADGTIEAVKQRHGF